MLSTSGARSPQRAERTKVHLDKILWESKIRNSPFGTSSSSRFQEVPSFLVPREETNSFVSSTPKYLQRHVNIFCLMGYTVLKTDTVIKISAKSSTSSPLPCVRKLSNE